MRMAHVGGVGDEFSIVFINARIIQAVSPLKRPNVRRAVLRCVPVRAGSEYGDVRTVSGARNGLVPWSGTHIG
jgi:hypothetical protein